MELNEYLQPVNSPITSQGVISGYDFTTTYQRNSVIPTKIPILPVSKLTAGTIVVAFNVGSGTTNGYLLLDGANNRIIVHDGTTNRIVIGSV